MPRRFSNLVLRHKKKLFPLVLTLASPLASTSFLAAQDFQQNVQGMVAPSTMMLTLPECISLGLQQQPRIAAQRASLSATQDGARAVESLRFAGLISREIPIRKRQAMLGISSANAGVDLAERDTTEAITRSYYTALFAREQERIIRSVVQRLSAVQESAKRSVDAGSPDVTTHDTNRTIVYLRLAETKQIQAEQGSKRALAALREAMGLGAESCIDIPPGQLVAPQIAVNRDEILACTLSRRGELIRANVFAEVSCLEVDAQSTTTHLQMKTFAAASDIHSVAIPPGANGADYRPAGVPPEMPSILAGSRFERMQHARTLHTRALTVIEATRNSITLEADDAILRWQEAHRQAAKAKEAAEAGDKLADNVNKDFTAGLKVKIDEVLTSRVLASQARAEYNEFTFREILALASLERITAGGFNAGLNVIPPPPAPVRAPAATPPKKEEDKPLFPGAAP